MISVQVMSTKMTKGEKRLHLSSWGQVRRWTKFDIKTNSALHSVATVHTVERGGLHLRRYTARWLEIHIQRLTIHILLT